MSLTATPEAGAAVEDFVAPAEATFERGASLTQTVTVRALEDDSSDIGERIALGFGTRPKGLVAGEQSTATVLLVNRSPNNPAISGPAHVGATPTTSADGIADADGLAGATFTWQWVSNDGTEDTDIPDTTESTYTVSEANLGKTLGVRVHFPDDGDREETLVSEPTANVIVALNQFRPIPIALRSKLLKRFP